MRTKAWEIPVEQRIVFEDVSWEYYEATLREFDERHLRTAYDGDFLELMKPSNHHKYVTKCLSRLIETYAILVGRDVTALGRLTCIRNVLRKGIDPDACYYAGPLTASAQNGASLPEHPIPDLVIEVRISPPAVDRPAIFAALGVPELRLFEDGQIEWQVLSQGRYQATERSQMFPQLDRTSLDRYATQAVTQGQSQAVFDFADKIQQNAGFPERTRNNQ